jgi:hypothetical protein
MNVGYEILLARISTHPEEFALANSSDLRESRWGAQLEIAFSENASGGFITSEQRKALRQALIAAQGDAFTKGVLHTLFEEFDDDSSGEPFPLFRMNGGQR